MDRLLPLVYDQLKRMAQRHLARERKGHTLGTTGLVHEAYLKLVDESLATAESRAYFFGAAARAMRQILVDYARSRLRKKRGGGRRAVTLDEHRLVVNDFAAEVLEIDDALKRLAEVNSRAARVVECRFFGGLSVEETAVALNVSSRTVIRDWIIARAWLFRTLHGHGIDEK